MKEFDLEYVKNHWKEAQKGELVQTRDGKPVRLLCIDAKSTYSIIGLIKVDDKEDCTTWTEKGECATYAHAGFDLVMKPTKHEGYINLFRADEKRRHVYVLDGDVYNTEMEAIERAKDISLLDYIKTIHIEWEE